MATQVSGMEKGPTQNLTLMSPTFFDFLIFPTRFPHMRNGLCLSFSPRAPQLLSPPSIPLICLLLPPTLISNWWDTHGQASPMTCLPISPTTQRLFTGLVLLQQILCLVRHWYLSFHVCFSFPKSLIFLPFYLGLSTPTLLCSMCLWTHPIFLGGHYQPSFSKSPVFLRPLGLQTLSSALYPPDPTWSKPLAQQLLFHHLWHVFQIIQVMYHDGLGGAQGHWCECCLEAGQPVDGRGHFLRIGTQRLRGTEMEERRKKGFPTFRVWGGLGRGWLWERMEQKMLGMERN